MQTKRQRYSEQGQEFAEHAQLHKVTNNAKEHKNRKGSDDESLDVGWQNFPLAWQSDDRACAKPQSSHAVVMFGQHALEICKYAKLVAFCPTEADLHWVVKWSNQGACQA